MPFPRPRPFLRDVLFRALRFFYLLWGGMLLSTLAFYGRLRLPSPFWHWPGLCRALMGPWGRALALGFGLVMGLAAAEVTIGLALVVALYRKKDTIQVDQINLLKG